MPQPRHTLSAKIVSLIAIAVIILISVIMLITYNRPKNGKNRLTATVFSTPRPVQPFQLSSHALFTQDNFDRHWTLLFFGFTHCPDVCPTTLAVLNDVYQQLHSRYTDLQVVFVSIDPEHDKLNTLQHYAASFNGDFIGVTGTMSQLQNIQQQFGIFAEKGQHTNSIFLINPQKQWIALFSYPMQASLIIDEFKRITQ